MANTAAKAYADTMPPAWPPSAPSCTIWACTTPIMGDIADAGVNVFDPFQPEAMDIGVVRRTYRGRLAF